MRSRKELIGLAALLAVATAVPAFGQPSSQAAVASDYPVCSKQVTEADSELAHSAYLAGKGFYDTSKWEAAIVKFREAYSRDCTKHELLVILSRAYEFNHDLPNAIKALQTYIARVPNAPDKKTYEDRIHQLQAQQDEAAHKAQPSAQPSASTTPPPPSASSSTPAQPPSQGEMREHTIWPWVVATIGGASLVTGIILVAVGPKPPSNCDTGSLTCTKVGSETPAEVSSDQDKANSAVNVEKAGIVLMIAGGAVLAGGIIWHFLEPTGAVSGKPILTPAVGPGYAGASLGASF
ncbi:MAG TPA: hypothetical protein VIF62_09440 [Labilithrix sp.]